VKLALAFVIAVAGIIAASEFVITSATAIARSFRIPEAVIALTLVALGTSIPEVATCIAAARKGHGTIALGNILGADIMNICWVAGASAIANDLVLSKKQIFFMFPSMFVIVGAMLIMLRMGYRLTRKKGIILFVLYVVYLASFFKVFPPQ
jgi:cation:H+ antiporter